MTIAILSALAIVAALAAARAVGTDGLAKWAEAAEPRLRRVGPLGAAVVSIAVVWFVWGAAAPLPKIQDEMSYLLQADIFARGRWTVPSPPIPDFFEQPHVQVVPAVASKYPPGHALLLAAGAIVGFHALVPLLLTGVTAALVFALAARVTTAWIALLAWIVWLTAPIVLRFQPSYLSEVTTAPLVLAAWWALLDWRASRRSRWLLLLAIAVGWGAITRPLTMLVFAIPIGIVVLRDAIRLRLWRDLALALAVGVAVLALFPLWSANTTGDWRVSPLEQYRRDYLPFDKLGFSLDTTPPRRTVSPVLQPVYDYNRHAHAEQSLRALPETIAARAVNLGGAFFQGARLTLLVFAIIGLFAMPMALRFAVVSAAGLFVAHLPYATWAAWTVYYLETTPVVSLLVGVGVWRVVQRVVHEPRRAVPGVLLITGIVAAFAIPSVDFWHRDHRGRSWFDSRFAELVTTLPTPAIVFVQYSPRSAVHVNVVFNHADLERAPVWVVHDLGPRNEELRRMAPERASFDFNEEQLLRQPREPR